MSSSGIYQGSDYVIICHNPSKIKAIGEFYGPPLKDYPKGLPTRVEGSKCIFLHLLKNRFGEPDKISWFVEQFKHSKINEYKPR